MRKSNVGVMSVDALIDRFAQIAVEQDTALLGGQIAKFNRLYDRMTEVREELKWREGDQRRALLRLFDHPNMQVRLQAARSALAVAPVEAWSQIEAIARSKWFPQAGDAGMCLSLLDDGTFKPT